MIVVYHNIFTNTIHHISMEEYRIQRWLWVYSDLGLVQLVYPAVGEHIALVVEDCVVDVGSDVVRIKGDLEGVRIVNRVDVCWVESSGEDSHVIRCDEIGSKFLLASEGLIGIKISGICEENKFLRLAQQFSIHVM